MLKMVSTGLYVCISMVLGSSKIAACECVERFSVSVSDVKQENYVSALDGEFLTYHVAISRPERNSHESLCYIKVVSFRHRHWDSAYDGLAM